MKHILFIALLLWGLRASAQSVETDSMPPITQFRVGFVGEIGFQYAIINLPAFREFLQDNNINRPFPLSNMFVLRNGFRINRVKFNTLFALGVTGEREISGQTQNNWVVNSTGFFQDGIHVGYDVLNSRNHRLFVGGGVGGTSLGYRLYRRSSATIPFNTILQANAVSSVPSLRLQRVGFYEVFVEYGQREKRKRSLETTFRLGYQRGLGGQTWTSDAYRLSDPLRERMSMLYFQIGLSLSTNADKGRDLFQARWGTRP